MEAAEKTTVIPKDKQRQRQLQLELEETLRETLAALRICGSPVRESYRRVWRHAQESAHRVLARVAAHRRRQRTEAPTTDNWA